jgi:hypothetical protein
MSMLLVAAVLGAHRPRVVNSVDDGEAQIGHAAGPRRFTHVDTVQLGQPEETAIRRSGPTLRSIYDNRWVSVGLADISLPSGERFEHHTVTLPAAAMTVVLDDAGERVLLSWRPRFVPDLWNWEQGGR